MKTFNTHKGHYLPPWVSAPGFVVLMGFAAALNPCFAAQGQHRIVLSAKHLKTKTLQGLGVEGLDVSTDVPC